MTTVSTSTTQSIARFTVNNVTDFIETALSIGRGHARHLWWRGQAKKDWHLVPGVFRQNRGSMYESESIRAFMRRARALRPDCPDRHDRMEWLALMQHYRLKTRLLDWSGLPVFALLCAVEEETSSDGTVWALNQERLDFLQGVQPGSQSEELVSDLVDAAFLRHVPSQLILSADAPVLDRRMEAQLAHFTIHGSASPLEDREGVHSALAAIDIPSRAKLQIKHDLHYLGFSQSTFFPDLEGLAREIDMTIFTDPIDEQ
jgi:hypothetical protein